MLKANLRGKKLDYPISSIVLHIVNSNRSFSGYVSVLINQKIFCTFRPWSLLLALFISNFFVGWLCDNRTFSGTSQHNHKHKNRPESTDQMRPNQTNNSTSRNMGSLRHLVKTVALNCRIEHWSLRIFAKGVLPFITAFLDVFTCIVGLLHELHWWYCCDSEGLL